MGEEGVQVDVRMTPRFRGEIALLCRMVLARMYHMFSLQMQITIYMLLRSQRFVGAQVRKSPSRGYVSRNGRIKGLNGNGNVSI